VLFSLHSTTLHTKSIGKAYKFFIESLFSHRALMLNWRLLIFGYSEASKILKKIGDVYLLNKEEYEANLEAVQNLFI